ncbi:8-oxo-dGTP diphosphatase [Pseudomonas duriflava]|uniref:8-oxo-dGTP diphosphatase n=1 Tax=Pseudomonas duriflava TaxID=459528 RepID=A0A562QPN2_9PSED|nr:NUDIX hydrolase [Pseudomonas duriflava]TWI58709.1 8-oxo-dGTP diphosphatase [Pseudomonas duriflava]
MLIAPFTGAKLALIAGSMLLTYKRDQKTSIPFPGCWDFAGGGREGDEHPIACALRELEEEFSLQLPAERIHWGRRYTSVTQGCLDAYFFVGTLTAEDILSIRFGNEGQYWRMMPINEFLAHSNAVPYLQARLRDYLNGADNLLKHLEKTT